MILLTSQKNDVFDLIAAAGMDPAQFEFSMVRNPFPNFKDATMLAYKGSKYYFVFQTARGAPHSRFSPGEETLEEIDFPGSWPLLKENFARWLTYLKRELDADEKWAKKEA